MNSSAAAVGGAVGVSPTPNTVAPGTYNVRLSDAVPMMADFDDALELGVVEGVNISSRGTSSDFDARFAVRADEAGTPSSTLVYRNDIPGGTVSAGGAGDVSLTVNQDSAVNLFTHYAVTGTDRRDLMAGDVVLTESYVTSRDAVMTVSLEYQAADDTEIHISYRSSGAGNAVTAVTTWQAASGASLDIGGTVISVGGMGMSDIRDAVNGAGIAGITASVDSLGASRRIILSNSSGGDVAVTETGVGPDGLGLAGVVADGGTAAGTFREYQRSVTLSMNGSGLRISQRGWTLSRASRLPSREGAACPLPSSWPATPTMMYRWPPPGRLLRNSPLTMSLTEAVPIRPPRSETAAG
jgi:hypothetical protein